jgi:DNA-binding GntR family transcriptional regulator
LDARRLPPGTKLPEVKLAALLGVSRERVRKALHRLAYENRLELIPNRGAFVPSLTPAAVSEIFEARWVLESSIAAFLARQPERIDRNALRRHLADQRKALDAGDEVRIMHLAQEFHRLLASMFGNAALTACASDFLARSNLLWSRHAPRPLSGCGGPAEHFDIAEAILRGDSASAARLMETHMRATAQSLEPDVPSAKPVDFDTVFGRAERATRRAVHARVTDKGRRTGLA